MNFVKLVSPIVGSLSLVASLTTTQSVFAEEAFMVTGPISHASWVNRDETGLNRAFISHGSYQMTVVHDSSTPLTDSAIFPNGGGARWLGATKSIEYVVFDSDGEEFISGVVEYNPDYINTLNANLTYRTAFDYGFRQEVWTTLNYHRDDSTQFDGRAMVKWWDNYADDVSQDILEIENYPSPLDNTTFEHSVVYGSNSVSNFNTGHVTSQSFGGIIADASLADTDGDGIIDPEDACQESELSDTVVISGTDAGVENVLLDSGCTINDVITLLQAEESSHGSLVSGVSEFINHLKGEGIITGREKGMLQSTVARTNGKGKSR